MLDSFRSSKSNVFFWIIMVLLILGLAGFGIGGGGGGGGTTEVARVGDHEITVDEYAQALNTEQQRFFAGYGRAPNAQEIEGLGMQVIGQLLSAAAFDGEAERLGISVSDDRVRQQLLQTSAFSDAAGNFDKTAYEFALQNADLTPAEYDDIVRSAAARRLVEAGIGGGVQFPDTAAEAIVSYVSEKRPVSWVRVGPSALDGPSPEPTEEDLAGYHGDNEGRYTLPERRVVTYAAVTEDELIDTLDISQDDLRALYEERMDFYSRPERRLLDRIVFADTAAAKAALARIEDGSAGFDDIAAERGLAPGDTDIGEATREDLSADEEALLFATDEVGVVGPVDSDLGPALYRINAALNATQTPFDEAEEELRNEVGRDQADALIAEEVGVIEDLLAGGATIEEVAADTLLTLGTITIAPDTLDGIAADASFRDEALAAEVGEFRELADLSDGVFVLRVDEIKPPEVQALDVVREAVIADWTADQVQAAVEALAEDAMGELQEGKTLGAVAAERGFIVTDEEPLDRRGIVEGTTPAFVAAVFENAPGEPFLITDFSGALIGVAGETEAPDLAEDGLARAVEFATEDMRAGVTDDVLTLFSRAVQDRGGVSTNRTILQQINQQFSSGL